MQTKTALIVGASRGLGLALVRQYLKRDWKVVATVRQPDGTALPELAKTSPGRLEVETLDITEPAQIAALKKRSSGRKFDLLFVNAGVANSWTETVADVSTDAFVKVMVTNSLSPMRVIDSLQSLVTESGTIGVMSSGQGSIADNERGGGDEIYRASKAALNMLMRSFAARTETKTQTLLLIAPGWIRTDMGGPEGRYSIEEAIPRVVDTIEAQRGKPGLQFLDQFGKPVRW